jgi:hypothetical protein
MSETGENKVLSLEEGLALLGAEQPEEIGEVSLDPIGLHILAAMIGQRLASRGGRPTDVSWEIHRKVPMKRQTWDQLNEMAAALAAQDVRVAPGQLAAVALERGVSNLTQDRNKTKAAVVGMREIQFTRYKFRDETEEEARELVGAIGNRRFW